MHSTHRHVEQPKISKAILFIFTLSLPGYCKNKKFFPNQSGTRRSKLIEMLLAQMDISFISL